MSKASKRTEANIMAMATVVNILKSRTDLPPVTVKTIFDTAQEFISQKETTEAAKVAIYTFALGLASTTAKGNKDLENTISMIMSIEQ